jgi:hypothetical protein
MAHASKLMATIAATLLFLGNLASAQERSVAGAPAPSWQVWANWEGSPAFAPGKKVFVVTIAKPRHRQSCRVENLSSAQLVCSRRLGRKPIVYRQQDVLALIDPGFHTRILPYFLGFVGAGAGTITGAVFLASISVVAAVPVAIIGGLILLASPLTAMAADGDTPEVLLYLAPGHQLPFALRK